MKFREILSENLRECIGNAECDCGCNDPIDEAEAWQTKKGKNKNGGLNKKGVASYRRSHPGSHLQTAVTTKPSKLKKGSKASKRRKSFCARMRGMKKHRTGAKTAHDPNSRINKSLRKWHCESIEEMRDLIVYAEAYIAETKQRLDPKCWTGKHKEGTKIKGGIRVNNCVPNEDIDEAANAAQQAAIAIAKKEVIGEFIDVNKAPENFDVYEDSYGSDYDFTVGKTKIEVTFKEYNENYYILAFENKTQSRPDTHAATGTERDTVFKIFNGVAYCLNHFIARHPKTEVIVMGAKSNEPSRIKLYDRAAKFFEQMGFKAVTDPVQQKKIFSDDASGYKLYVYKKKVSAPTNENFADGKGPGRAGDSARHGIPKHATKSELEKASHAKGRKGQLARWMANMRSGQKKHHKE